MKYATLLLGVLVLCAPAHAAILGPVDVLRDTAKPQETAFLFARGVIASEYRLTVENGPSGTSRVSSASVELNGDMVVRERDLNQNSGSIERSVALRPQNRLVVRLAGAPGGVLRIRIEVVFGANGGTIATESGAELVIPPGALAGDASVSITDVPLEELDAAIPDGYTAFAAVALSFGGATLNEEADLSVPHAAPLAGVGIAARLLPLGDETKFVLADTASVAGGRLRTDSPPFTGIRSGGTYTLMQMPPGLGIAPVHVKNAAGVPAAGSLAKLQIESTSAAPSMEATANASLAAFVGEANASGFAPVPGVPPDTQVIAVAATPPAGGTGLAGISKLSLGDVLANGLLHAVLDEIIVERLFDIDDIQPPDPCDCTSLLMNPSQILPVAGLFSPGTTQQLAAYCMPSGDTVTQSSPTPDWKDLLANGLSIHVTRYSSANTDVATVDAGGLVTAAGQGATSVTVKVVRVRLVQFAGVVFPQFCFAQGGVQPLYVLCPNDAPYWNATRRRCEAVFTMNVLGPGSVTSAPPAFSNCRSACSATWPAGATLFLSASPDAGARLTSWSGACTGNAITSTMTVQHGDVCTARFATGTIQFQEAVCVVRYQFWPPRDLPIVRVYGTINAPPESRFRVTLELMPDSGTWWSPPALVFFDDDVDDQTEFGEPWPFPRDGRLANWALPGPQPYAMKVRAFLDGVQHDERTIGCTAGFEP